MEYDFEGPRPIDGFAIGPEQENELLETGQTTIPGGLAEDNRYGLGSEMTLMTAGKSSAGYGIRVHVKSIEGNNIVVEKI